MRRALSLLLGLLCLAGAGRIAAGAAVPAKAVAAQWLLDRAFERSLASQAPEKPWPWADMAPIARLRAPRLGISRLILDSGSGQAMAFGPTLLPGGAAPGRLGTTVIAAHRDTHFRFLERVRAGDRLELEGRDGVVHAYRVEGAEIVRWDRFAVADRGAANELALATCYPFGALGHGPLRYVVRAVAV
jgi:sortase A